MSRKWQGLFYIDFCPSDSSVPELQCLENTSKDAFFQEIFLTEIFYQIEKKQCYRWELGDSPSWCITNGSRLFLKYVVGILFTACQEWKKSQKKMFTGYVDGFWNYGFRAFRWDPKSCACMIQEICHTTFVSWCTITNNSFEGDFCNFLWTNCLYICRDSLEQSSIKALIINVKKHVLITAQNPAETWL